MHVAQIPPRGLTRKPSECSDEQDAARIGGHASNMTLLSLNQRVVVAKLEAVGRSERRVALGEAAHRAPDS